MTAANLGRPITSTSRPTRRFTRTGARLSGATSRSIDSAEEIDGGAGWRFRTPPAPLRRSVAMASARYHVSHVTVSTSKRRLAFPDLPHDLAMQLVDLASWACEHALTFNVSVYSHRAFG